MEPEASERLKKKRTVLRAAVTKICKDISSLLKDQDSAQNFELDISKLNGKMDLLKDKWQTLKNLDEAMEEVAPLNELEEEMSTAMGYEDNVKYTLSCATRCIAAQVPNEGNQRVYNEQSRSSLPRTVKLPKLEFPKFTGELTKWAAWWERYSTSIDKNSELATIDKFNYLRSLVCGAAESTISGIPVTEGNYEVAINKLTQRFGKHEAVTRAHLRRLLNLEKLRTGDLAELRSLHDELSNNMASLQSLGVSPETYESLLFAKVRDLLTEGLAKDFRLSRRDATLEDFMKFLIGEIEAKEEDGCTVEVKEKNKFAKRVNPSRTSETRPPQSSLAAFTTEIESKKPYCVFCNDRSHWTDDCTKEMTVSARKGILAKKGRCFKCMRSRHLARDCKAKGLSCATCKGKHHSLLCEPKKDAATSSADDSEKASQSDKNVQVMTSITNTNGVFFLQTFMAKFESGRNEMVGRGLLDGGGMRSFILKETSKQLNLPVVGYEQVTINAFGGKATSELCRRVKLKLVSCWDEQGIEMEVLEVDKICSKMLSLPSHRVEMFFKEKNWKLADPPHQLNSYSESEVHILIGVDYYWSVVKPKMVEIEPRLVAVDTLYGWVISGTEDCSSELVNATPATHLTVLKTVVEQNECPLQDEDLERFWRLEHLGIQEPNKPATGDTILTLEPPLHKNGRYEVRLPWLPDRKNKLADNYSVALRRLGSLQRKLATSVDLSNRYNEVIMDYLKKGIIEEVMDEQDHGESVYYMPHKPVIKEDRATTKLRIVFDASSHAKEELSLNNCLWQGPDLYNDLFKLLIRFRTYKVAIVGDIEKAFLQISIDCRDRDAIRFLWCCPPFEGGNVKTYRFTRVVFGVTSSPALLASTLLYMFKEERDKYPETVDLLAKSMYVDDFVTSVQEIQKARQVKKDVDSILQTGGFRMCKWLTNAEELRCEWEEEKEQPEYSNNLTKVLGLVWDYKEDRCAVSPFETSRCAPDTKRTVIQEIARVFDPLGILAPFTIRAKIIMQKLWKCKISWDDPVPDHVKQLWLNWHEELQFMKDVTVPRWIGLDSDIQGDAQLHVFVDASLQGYAAVAYIRSQKISDSQIRFVACKTRVSPLKELTLPRLELMAAVLGVRLYTTIMEALDIKFKDVFFWTDSQITLTWIRGPSYRWKPFVANRVNEIQRLSNVQCWKYCPGTLNPADEPSRGISIKDVKSWSEGPTWLRKDEMEWPTVDCNYVENAMPDEYVNASVEVERVEPTLPWERYSNLNRLVRVTAWMHRVFLQQKKPEIRGQPLSAEEILWAESFMIIQTQKERFGQEIECIKNKKELPKLSVLRNFACFVDDDGFLRIRSRILNKELEENTRNPVILAADHPYVKLLIEHTHKRLKHAGVTDMLAEIRERFWLLKGRQQARKIVNACLACRKLKSKLKAAPIGPLPTERSQLQPPFETTGVDFAGPLLVKMKGMVSSSKVYVALFTCATTRAIHLELVPDLTASSFLLCFCRFISRRDICKVMYSDNASTFKKANRDLQRILKAATSATFKDFVSGLHVEWRYIVEKAPWWGGFWERLVQSVKNSLKRTLGRSLLMYDELNTVLIEIEAVINSRPLTSLGPLEDEGPLTPAHFLTGSRLTVLPASIKRPISGNASTVGELRRRLRVREKCINDTCKRWKNEYLGLLKSAHVGDQHTSIKLKVGDLVLLNKENTPRHRWPTARVLSLNPGRDGHIRSGSLKMADGTIVRRPTALMIPLEVQ